MRYRSTSQAPLGAAAGRLERESQHTMENESTHQDEPVPLKKTKRFRSAFTTEQIKYLDTEFKKYPYIGSARRKEVSNALSLPERAVKIWFQNRRMKEKKDVPSAEPNSDEHKNSRKIDFGNDQLSNECTVTSTNNQILAPLSLISPKIPKNVGPISIKKEDQVDPINNKRPTQNIDNITTHSKSSAEFSIELFKQYNNYIGKPKVNHVRPLAEVSSVPSQPTTAPSPKNEVSSTSPYDKHPQDLSRKRKPPQVKAVTVESSAGGYFPLNLKKYCAQPSLPVGGSVVWKPFQVVPVVGAASVSPGAGCRCDCRCRPPAAPAPALLQSAPSVPQYVLTALPLQNPYYKY